MATQAQATPSASSVASAPAAIVPRVIDSTPTPTPIARPSFEVLHKDSALQFGLIHVLGVNLIRGVSAKNGNRPYEIPQLVVSGLDPNGQTAAGTLPCSREVIAKVTQVGMYRYTTGLATQREKNELALRVTDVELVKG